MTDKKTSGAPTAKERAHMTAESVKDATEATGLAAPSAAEVEKARKEGVMQAIREDGAASYRFATNGALPGAEPGRQFTFSDAHSNVIDGMLALGPDELEAAVDEKADAPLTEEQVANLLKLERNGPNRTPHVQILCKRLKVKSPLEVPGAGTAPYTNDVSNLTPISRPGE